MSSRDDDEFDGADSDRDAILARRRLLVASALAGLATVQCDNPFRPCLEPPPAPPPSATPADAALRAATAQPCLEPMPEDAGAPAPRPCLKIAVPPESKKR